MAGDVAITVEERRALARQALVALRRWKEAGHPGALPCRFTWHEEQAPSAITGRVRPPVERTCTSADLGLPVADVIVWSSGRLSRLRHTAREVDGVYAFDVEMPEQALFVDEAMTTFEEPVRGPGVPNATRFEGRIELTMAGGARRWRDAGQPTTPPAARADLMAAIIARVHDLVGPDEPAAVPPLPQAPVSIPPRPR